MEAVNISVNAYADADAGAHASGFSAASGGLHPVDSITLAKFTIETIQGPLAVTLFLLFVTIVKAVYYKFENVQAIIPESCVLIFCGLVVGVIINYLLGWKIDAEAMKLTNQILFTFILPPIMLEAAYSLHDRMFFENIGAILLYALIGTLLAFLSIGLACWGISAAGAMGMQLTLLPSLLFSSFIVAVDPVAVLAIFQDIGVDRRLYLLVFGESLLNDGVTVVLYNVMKELCQMDQIDVGDIFMGMALFFTVTVGGLVIGIIGGALSAFMLRFMGHVRVMEICVLLMMAYLSYIMAMLFDWSGIISIVTCGLVQVQYGFPNMHQKTRISAKYVAKMLALLFESLIFMYLGLEVITELFAATDWNTGFALWALFFCLLVRFIITFLLTAILNWSNRLKKISIMEQIIMSYGGLRGAIAFALVTTLDKELLEKFGVKRSTFVSTTLFIVLFTTVLMGLLTKPLVKLLKIRLEPEKIPSLLEEFNTHLEDHVKYGIEVITGRTGRTYWRQVLVTVDDYWIKPLLQNEPETRSHLMLKRFEKVSGKFTGEQSAYSVNAENRDSVSLRTSGISSSRDTFQAIDSVIGEDSGEANTVDLSGLTSNDLRRKSRDFSKLHALMQERAPSGVLRQRIRKSCVEEDAPYLLELKKRRRLMYTLYNMQKKTMKRKQMQLSYVENAPIPKPTTAMQRLARQVAYSNSRREENAPSSYHSLPRPGRSGDAESTNVQVRFKSRTLDRPRRRKAVISTEVSVEMHADRDSAIRSGVEDLSEVHLGNDLEASNRKQADYDYIEMRDVSVAQIDEIESGENSSYKVNHSAPAAPNGNCYHGRQSGLPDNHIQSSHESDESVLSPGFTNTAYEHTDL